MTDKKITNAIAMLEENGYIIVPKSKNHYNEVAHKAIFDIPLKQFLSLYLPKATVTRIYNVMNYKGDPETKFLGQLLGRTRAMVSGYSNLGKNTLMDLERALFKHVLILGMNTTGWVPPVSEEVEEEKREYPPLPDSYYLDYIDRFMPAAHFPMGATAAMFHHQVRKWPIMNDTDTIAMVVVSLVDQEGYVPVMYVGIGKDIRYYPRGLAVAEFKALVEEDWAQTPGEVRVGVEKGKMLTVKYITSVRPQVLKDGWMANEVLLVT